MKLYQIASLGLTDDNKWGVTYVGTVAQQGGNEFSRGQLFFETLENALNFLCDQTRQHVDEYEKIVKEKK